MIRWLLIVILFVANINLIWATEKPAINALLELEKKIKRTAQEKHDYVFTEVYNAKPIFVLPDIPIFQITPQLQCAPRDVSCFLVPGKKQSKEVKGTKNNAPSIDVYFHFQVKALHIVTIDDESNSSVKRSYLPKDRTTFQEKSFHDVSVKVQGWGGSFHWTQVNADISTGFWEENAGPGSLSLKQTELEMTFDTKYNRVIFKTLQFKEGSRFIIFDLSETGEKVQLTLRSLFQNTVTFKVTPLTTDKNRNIFDPPGLKFDKLHVPGELYEQSDKDLILTQNFTPESILFEDRLLVTPVTCPTEENPFELKLTFKIKGLQDDAGKHIPIHRNFNTVVATVVCGYDAIGWNFENSPFMLGDLVYGILFDSKHEKVVILNFEKTPDFQIRLEPSFEPTLEVQNLRQDKFAKIHFSEFKNFSANSSPLEHQSEDTESLTFRSDGVYSSWQTPARQIDETPTKFSSTNSKMNGQISPLQSSTKHFRSALDEIYESHPGSESSSSNESPHKGNKAKQKNNARKSKYNPDLTNVTSHSFYYKN
jgi:hypothetical protein